MLDYCTNLEIWQQMADVLVSCSRREGLPLNIVEAMLSGNPVVATKNRGHRELIIENKTGWLVDVGDEQTMARKVLELLDDEILRKNMGAEAARQAKRYGFANVKQELEQIYFG